MSDKSGGIGDNKGMVNAGCCVGLVRWELSPFLELVGGPLGIFCVGVARMGLAVCEAWRFFPVRTPVEKGPPVLVVGSLKLLSDVVKVGLESDVSTCEAGFGDKSVGRRPFGGTSGGRVRNKLIPLVLDVVNLFVDDALFH